MRNIAGQILLLLAVGLLFGCGTDEAFTARTATDTTDPTATPSSIQLLVSSPQLASAGTESVTLTAIVMDNNNAPMEGVSVDFSADSGTIPTTQSVTDSTGTAVAVLTTGDDKTNRTINVSACVDAVCGTNTVQVTGTTISISGPASAAPGETVTLTITLTDSAAAGIPGQSLTLTSALGNTISDLNPTTGSDGTVTVTVMLNASETDTITVSGTGATATHTISVSTDNLVFSSPADGAEAPLGTDQTITIQWTSGGSNVVGQTVSFATTLGTLSSPSETTDSNGQATVTIRSDNNAGSAVITATASGGGPTALLNLLFVATTTNSMTLQASPATIGNNPTGGSTEQSEIIADVRDANNNPVVDKQIDFTLTDTTGGSLSSLSATTDSFGRASVFYIASAAPSAPDGVQIDASVADTPSVSGTVYITVVQSQWTITLDKVNDPNEPDPASYALPYSVTVKDTNGDPVANAQITLSISPEYYRKGSYVWSDTTSKWEQVFTLQTVSYCENEDVNRNGVEEFASGTDIDENSNGVLDPGNVVTLSTDTVTTDASGSAQFEVRYLQQYAQWVNVKLTAQSAVSGSEGTASVSFDPPILPADVADMSVQPPGDPSPFGTGQSCAIEG